jgi:transposase
MPITNLEHSIDFAGQEFYVGIDVHKKSWTVTVRTLNLEVDRFTQPPNAQSLANHLFRRFPNGKFLSAYEAGFCGTSYHSELHQLGIRNIIVHPADIPSTDKQKKTKNDLHDSRSIAYYLEKHMLRGIYIFPKSHQELRSLFRFRQSKVKDVTRATNKIKSFLQYSGIGLLKGNTNSQITHKDIQWLNNLTFDSPAGSSTLQHHLSDLQYHRKQLLDATGTLRKQMIKMYPEQLNCLLSVPGIGPITAMAFLAEIGDFGRFKDPDEYNSYLGLIPWEKSSGESLSTKGMQPRCNRFLRPLLIETSWAAIRYSPELLVYYRKHAVKNNKHAIVKVARKIALIARAVVLQLKRYNSEYKCGSHQVA